MRDLLPAVGPPSVPEVIGSVAHAPCHRWAGKPSYPRRRRCDLASRPGHSVLSAFLILVVLGGSNAIAVKVSLAELAPFWSAATRFTVAGLLLLGLMLAWRRPIPRGDHLLGSVLFGIFAFALPYAFLYHAIRVAGAGTTMTILAIVPLLTVLLAAAHGVERLRVLGVGGALVAGLGIVVIAADRLTLDVPLSAIVLLLLGAAAQAESVVIVKRVPPGDTVAANAIGQLVGGALLLGASILVGEPWALPVQPDTWAAWLYLVGLGSVVLFILALYVLARWTASATSYAFLLFPLVATGLGAILLREPIQPSFVVGGLVVLLGVYVGAVYRPRRSGRERVPEPA